MAINLDSKFSQQDINAANDILHPPEFTPGFEGSGGPPSDTAFDDIFGNAMGGDGGDSLFGDDLFGGSGASQPGGQTGDPLGFGGQPNPSGQSGFGQSGFGQTGFGQTGFGQTGFGQNGAVLGQNPFMNGGAGQQTMQTKPDMLDKGIDAAGEAAMSFGKVLIELFKSLKLRNADDFGYLSRNLILTGLGVSGASILLGIIGIIQGVGYLGFAGGGFGLQTLGAGLLCVGTGFMGMGFSAIKKTQCSADNNTQISDLTDISQEIQDDATSDYEDSIGDIMDDLFGEGLDSINISDEPEAEPVQTAEPEEVVPNFGNMGQIDLEEQLKNIRENQILSRQVLFDTFLPFLPTNTKDFDRKDEITEDNEDFAKIQYLALKALANIAKCEADDVKSKLIKCVETLFSYELTMTRVKGLNKTDDIAREMEIYFKDNSSDEGVNATVEIEGDNYKIIITKGVSAVVTLMDAFKLPHVREYFLDEKHKLPMITGISELGDVVLDDAKVFDTMLIAGKPRSGKSWYVLSMLMSFMMFNSPEDVQFIIIDPKESNLFKTIALMPHVAGLHNEQPILEVLDDIIENEAPRRKKLLSDNHVDDIWALRKKGIKLPILYIFIDEFIAASESLGPASKDLSAKMRVIISQLPSLGIRLIFIAHRSTGVVDKTNRTLLQFTASIKGEIDEIKDTLGISRWTRALTQPGDTAVKTSSRREALFVKGVAVTTDDEKNTELIESVAKAFYKMGVDLPDMSALKMACNRDENYIKERLTTGGTRVQYSNWDSTDLNLD